MFARDCSFWRYKVYVDIRYGSHDKTSVNSGVVESDQFWIPLVALFSNL